MTKIDTGTDDLHLDIADGIALFTFTRPDRRNALSGPMLAAFGAGLARVETDPAVRCVVVTGAGGAFCAGGDVKGFAERIALASAPVAAQGATLFTSTPNSLTKSVEPGKRDFPIGVDKTGRPVTVNEN